VKKFFAACLLFFVFVSQACAGTPTWRVLVLVVQEACLVPSDEDSWSAETIKRAQFSDDEIDALSQEVRETFSLIENLSSIKNRGQISVKFDLDLRGIDYVVVMVDGDWPAGAVSIPNKDRLFEPFFDLAVVIFKDQLESDLSWQGHAYVGRNVYNNVPTAFCAVDTDEPLMPYLRNTLLHELAHLLRENWLVKGFWLPPVHDCYRYDDDVNQLSFFYDWFAGCIKQGKKDVGVQPKMWQRKPSRQEEVLRQVDLNDSQEKPRRDYQEDQEYEVRCFKLAGL